MIERREFIPLLGGAAVAASRCTAQQPVNKLPLIAVLIAGSERHTAEIWKASAAADSSDIRTAKTSVTSTGSPTAILSGSQVSQQTWFAATRTSSYRHRWPHIWRPNRPPPPSRL